MTTGGSFPGPGPEPEPVSAAALELLEAGVEAVLDLDADRLDHRTLHEAVVKMRRLSSRFDAAEGHLADRWDVVKVWSAEDLGRREPAWPEMPYAHPRAPTGWCDAPASYVP